MNYNELFNALVAQLGYKPTAQAIADIIGTKRQTIYTRSQRPEQKFALEELLKIERAYNVQLINGKFSASFLKNKTPETIGQELKENFYKIPYWDKCANYGNLLVKPSVTEWVMDMQGIVLDWGANPDDLFIIAMPGEEMDKSGYPIRNNDILIIDSSRTNITESGIYFYSTLGGSRVFVRRLFEQMHGEVIVTVDNPVYSPMINATFTQQQLKDIDLHVIGRVIKNMSLKL